MTAGKEMRRDSLRLEPAAQIMTHDSFPLVRWWQYLKLFSEMGVDFIGYCASWQVDCAGVV